MNHVFALNTQKSTKEKKSCPWTHKIVKDRIRSIIFKWMEIHSVLCEYMRMKYVHLVIGVVFWFFERTEGYY